MKEEINVAVRFICRVIENNNANGGVRMYKKLEKEQIEVFKAKLSELLRDKYQDHWFPDRPAKGQGFRCIRVNESDRKDQVINQACESIGLKYEQLNLPAELTIWVDPSEIACRFGEQQGALCTLGTFKNGKSEIFVDQINLEEIYKRDLEHKEKVMQEASSRKNNVRRGILPNNNRSNGSSPNGFKGTPHRYTNGYNHNHQSPQPTPPHHHHHSGGHHHSPSPAAVSWFNSVSHAASSEMFPSSSPPNNFSMYNPGKFSPPKFGPYGSKWSAPGGPHYGPGIHSPGKVDKYHWVNKQIIKA